MRRVYFFIDDNGVQQGPVNIDFLMKHGIRPDAKIWFEGLPQWIDASDVSELKKMFEKFRGGGFDDTVL